MSKRATPRYNLCSRAERISHVVSTFKVMIMSHGRVSRKRFEVRVLILHQIHVLLWVSRTPKLAKHNILGPPNSDSSATRHFIHFQLQAYEPELKLDPSRTTRPATVALDRVEKTPVMRADRARRETSPLRPGLI